MAGQSQLICVDLRSLAAKKNLRWKNRTDVISISVRLYSGQPLQLSILGNNKIKTLPNSSRYP